MAISIIDNGEPGSTIRSALNEVITYVNAVSGSSVLTLTPQNPLPLGVPTGSFAVSASSPPVPYFYDGTNWNALY